MKDFQDLNDYSGEAPSDLETCHRFLYHSSPDIIKDKLTYARIFVLGDGYGSMTLGQLVDLDLMYDWSHVRDSSKEAVAEMAKAIRSAGF